MCACCWPHVRHGPHRAGRRRDWSDRVRGAVADRRPERRSHGEFGVDRRERRVRSRRRAGRSAASRGSGARRRAGATAMPARVEAGSRGPAESPFLSPTSGNKLRESHPANPLTIMEPTGFEVRVPDRDGLCRRRQRQLRDNDGNRGITGGSGRGARGQTPRAVPATMKSQDPDSPGSLCSSFCRREGERIRDRPRS